MPEVWGREDLTCPISRQVYRRLLREAYAHPHDGRQILDRRHMVDTTAITEPGRLTRVFFTFDIGHHGCGWWINSDYDTCLHISVCHPLPGRTRVYHLPEDMGGGSFVGMDMEAPSDDEVRAWGRVFFREDAPKAWFEPAASTLDPHRLPYVTHLRLFLDKSGKPILPRGEVYNLRPFEDGSSPSKVTDGRAGADVR